jgi:hypothetical protein
MRFSNVILGIFAVGIVGVGSLAGCGGSNGDTGGAGGSGAGTGTGTSTGGSTGTSMGAACALGASCKAVDKDCAGLVDNSGKTQFGLRMSELDVAKPTVLTTGFVAMTISGAVQPSEADCNLAGSGTFSWLIQFDTTAGTMKTGGAKPVTDPTMGYSFVDEMVTQGSNTFHIQPVTFNVTPDASGNFSIMTGTDLFVPIYLTPDATSVVILPLKQARLSMGQLSKSQNCIGSYNAAGLDPTNMCLPDAMHPSFVTGGQLDGIITLEDADGVIVSALGESLCVLLSGDTGMKNSAGVTVCTRDSNGKITAMGDSCSTGSGCTDAFALSAKFAASSVQINN